MNRRLAILACACVLMVPLALAAAGQQTPGPDSWRLSINPATKYQLSVLANADGSWTMTSTGTDPYISTTVVSGEIDEGRTHILAFEYKSAKALDATNPMEIFFYPPGKAFAEIPGLELKAAADWTPASFDLKLLSKVWDRRSKAFRFDFGSVPGYTITMRNVVLRGATDAEVERARRQAAREKAFFARCGIGLEWVKAKSASLETVRHADQQSATVVLSTYRYLDLDAQTKMGRSAPPGKALVPLAPPMVVGEGEHATNHTVVRILSPYQVAEVQFLAYPPTITGGAGVETLTLGDGRKGFVAWPLASAMTRELRIFNRTGGLVRTIIVGGGLQPPFTVAAVRSGSGRLGDEVMVTSRRQHGSAARLLCYGMDGRLRRMTTVRVNDAGEWKSSLLAGHDGSLVLQDLTRKTAYGLIGSERPPSLDQVPGEGVRLFASAYPDRLYNAGGPGKVVSSLYAVGPNGQYRSLDAGRIENVFNAATWFTNEAWSGRYVRKAMDHVRNNNIQRNYPMAWSPLVARGDIEGKSYDQWVAGVDWAPQPMPASSRIFFKDTDRYDEGEPVLCWFVPFSQRWPTADALGTGGGSYPLDALIEKKDPTTGLPLYLALGRLNEKRRGDAYVPGQAPQFEFGSLNHEQEGLNALYEHCQRAFYQGLAPLYRRNPEMTISVKPDHEDEITTGIGSIGDYNRGSIEGFYHYLLALYGSLASVNRVFGTPFTPSHFDAPRNGNRGTWDTYEASNPFLQAWMEYNRTVVYRRLAGAYRGVLLSGFPPEKITCHQIPDTYIFGFNAGVADGEPRISPIDWPLTAGTAFGYTRYGVDFRDKHNIAQGAHSSGFDHMLIGEYASLTPSLKDAYEQLLYLRQHGIGSLLVMQWPPERLDIWEAQKQALARMAAEMDTPLPGLAGGIGEARAYRGVGRRFDIVELGTQEENTGLLKSLRQDGSFEGTVYVVPFHAHVAVTTLVSKPTFRVPTQATPLCRVARLRAGSVIEVTFTTTARPRGDIVLQFLHRGARLPANTIRLKGLGANQHVRAVYKVPLIMGKVSLVISAPGGPVVVRGLLASHQQDQAISTTLGILDGVRHKGGVTFDVLE